MSVFEGARIKSLTCFLLHRIAYAAGNKDALVPISTVLDHQAGFELLANHDLSSEMTRLAGPEDLELRI